MFSVNKVTCAVSAAVWPSVRIWRRSLRGLVMCLFDPRVIVLILVAQVSAIHDSDRHSRHAASTEELMRRSIPKVRQQREDSDPEEVLLREAPKQAIRDRLSMAKELKDLEAFQAALKEGAEIGLHFSELEAFEDSFHQPPGGREFEAEALIQETDQPLGSSGSAPAAPGNSDGNALGPLVSSGDGEATFDTEKDEATKAIDFSSIDYMGCIIPQWSDGDWICAEAADVPEAQIYDDAQYRTRKKLREGDICTVECPDPRYWQKANPASLVCKRGRWRDEVSHINVRKIHCETSGRWIFYLGSTVIFLPLCCGCCGLCLFRRMRKKDQGLPPTADAAAPAPAPGESGEPAAPAGEPAAPAEAT